MEDDLRQQEFHCYMHRPFTKSRIQLKRKGQLEDYSCEEIVRPLCKRYMGLWYPKDNIPIMEGMTQQATIQRSTAEERGIDRERIHTSQGE